MIIKKYMDFLDNKKSTEKQSIYDNITSIKENKQVGILYHFTNVDGILGILQDNYLRPYHDNDMKKDFTSFTRNKNYLNEPGSNGKGLNLIRISIDGDKLSNLYKISPKHNINRSISKRPHGTGKYNKDEFEEVIEGGVKDIKKYILSIDIDKKSLIKLFTFNNLDFSCEDTKNITKNAKLLGVKEYKDFISKLKNMGILFNITVLNNML